MKESYQIMNKKDSRELNRFLAREGQFLLPILDLIQQSEAAVDEVIEVVGRSAIEAILLLSARQVADDQHPGKATGDIRWYGSQLWVISLSDRKLRITKPRLRKKGKGQGNSKKCDSSTELKAGTSTLLSAGRQKYSELKAPSTEGPGK